MAATTIKFVIVKKYERTDFGLANMPKGYWAGKWVDTPEDDAQHDSYDDALSVLNDIPDAGVFQIEKIFIK